MALFRYLILICCCCCYFATSSEIVYPCRTPNNRKGYCMSLFSCRPLLRSLGTLEKSAIDFAKRSICNRSNFLVCCDLNHNVEVDLSTRVNTTNSNTENKNSCTPYSTTVTISSTTANSITTDPVLTNSNPITLDPTISNTTNSFSTIWASINDRREFVRKNLLPSRRFCGFQQTDDRIYTEDQTAIDEFPWLGHVLFGDPAEEDTLEYGDRCNGFLINRRYVLTNDFCARSPTRVRFGQYNTNKTVSCVGNDVEFPECTEPAIEVPIEQEIHKDNGDDWFNFALFRLAHNVTFTDFVRPICLPLDEDTQKSENDYDAVISGWGAANQSGIEKKRLTYNKTDIEECYKLGIDVEISTVNVSLVCLDVEPNATQFACKGEEGGPLMYKHKHQWFADAVIMNVYTDYDCSYQAPLDALRITPEVINWILDTIEP